MTQKLQQQQNIEHQSQNLQYDANMLRRIQMSIPQADQTARNGMRFYEDNQIKV